METTQQQIIGVIYIGIPLCVPFPQKKGTISKKPQSVVQIINSFSIGTIKKAPTNSCKCFSIKERETGLEPATPSLGSLCSAN